LIIIPPATTTIATPSPKKLIVICSLNITHTCLRYYELLNKMLIRSDESHPEEKIVVSRQLPISVLLISLLKLIESIFEKLFPRLEKFFQIVFCQAS